MARPEKVAVVDEIKEKITSAGATVITEYRGLTVTELATLRAALREAGTSYKIYKNSLAKRAVEAADLADAGEVDGLLLGPTAWAFVDGDLGAAAKALKDFSKANEALVVKGGLLDGAFLTPEQVDEIAELPSREELLAKIAGGFKAPMAKAAGLFSALQRNTAYAIKALIDKRIEAGEEAPLEAPATDESDKAPEADASAAEAPEGAEATAEDEASPEAEATEDTAPAAEDSEGSEEASTAEEETPAGDETQAEEEAAPEASEDDGQKAEAESPEAAGGEAEEAAASDDSGQEAKAESSTEEEAGDSGQKAEDES